MQYLMACWMLLFAMMAGATEVVGTEQVIADTTDGPLALRIWYPVDVVGAPGGRQLPLIVISHGAGGDNAGHRDTARSLAEAGFVVAAVAHTGDTFRDQSAVRQGLHLARRPGQIVDTIDYMLSNWRGHARLDPQRVGLFGFSIGGFSTLVVAGGRPDLSRIALHCREQPAAWDCIFLTKNGLTPQSIRSPSSRPADARVKAAVVAAPAVAYSFEPDGLAGVRIPIQLWGARRDEIVGDGADIVRGLLPVVPDYQVVDNAGHFAFLAPCGVAMHAVIAVMELFGTESICSDPDGFDRRQFHARFNADVVAFFGQNLRR